MFAFYPNINQKTIFKIYQKKRPLTNEYQKVFSTEQKLENRINQHDIEIEWIKSQIASIQSQLQSL